MDTAQPTIPAAEPLSSQVGGHEGVLTTEDGSLIIKHALHREVEFYQALQQDELADLRAFTPKFIGTLKLEGQIDKTKPAEAGAINVTPVDVPEKESIVLENLSHPFLKPNILDVKLGTVFYDETASPEKVERMLKAARSTTSLESGMRFVGFQVYDNVTGEVVVTPKAYGKSIKVAELPEGIARFFPVHSPPDSDEPIKSTQGLRRDTLLPILRAIRDEVAEIRKVYASHEIRMVGGSLLIVYEADWARAKEGVRLMEAGGDGDEAEESDSEGDDEDGDDKRSGPPFVVKLIDFAHTRLLPGKGSDEGVLLGFDTLIRLFDERISQLA